MKIIFFGNTLNCHQANVSDVLYEITGGNYTYVETVPPREENQSGGKKRMERSYVFHAFENLLARNKAMEMARECDIALFGADSFQYELERMRTTNKLTFEVSERWLKRGWINMFSPHLLKNLWHYHINGWKNKPLYKLCSSAYGAGDQYKLQSFKNKCYKWGYFTNVEDLNIERIIDARYSGSETHEGRGVSQISIMWCGRFLIWKHPELPIRLASKLKAIGYSFTLDMYGCGELFCKIKEMATRLKVNDVVNFWGSVSNDEIHEAMRQHDIFLFTSDQREGWGAVLNEAMSNGCAVVASDAIGSVPFLIEDNKNGLVFKDKNEVMLFENVKNLFDDVTLRKQISMNAYLTMRDVWSPLCAANNLIKLCQNLQKGNNDSPILIGPCSKATPYSKE